MKRSRIFSLLVVFICCLFIINANSCDGSVSDAEKDQTKKTKEMALEVNKQIGMPNIVNFQERKLAKMIFELRDKENLVCYAYIKSEYTGKLIYIGKCIGYGLPYSVQYTNPEYIIESNWGNVSLPQPDPNQLYMPQGLSATWLMMIDPKTKKPRPVYIEPEIIVSPFRLH